MSEPEESLTSVDVLAGDCRAGETPRSNWRVGTEHEKIGIYTDTRERVPYEGPRGIGVLLGRIASADGWDPIEEAGNVIALQKEDASITLEPGGQLELSGAPLATGRETCAEFSRHVDLVKISRLFAPCGSQSELVAARSAAAVLPTKLTLPYGRESCAANSV